MPSWSSYIAMGYMEARCYMRSRSKSIFSVSEGIIEVDILSSCFPSLWVRVIMVWKANMEHLKLLCAPQSR